MNNLIIREYIDKKIEFKMIDNIIYVNANTMGNGKQIENWKNSPNTKRYIEALENKFSLKSRELILSKKGGLDVGGGTWIYEKLVLSLARYISVDFELWMDEQIATLIREGSVSLKPKTEEEMLLELFPSADNSLIALTAQNIRNAKKLEIENKVKQEIIERKTEIIDNMTEDLDEVRVRKIVTDYMSKYVKAKDIEYSEAYNDLYSFFGRAIKTDIEYQYKKYVSKNNEIVKENKAYNRENKLKGVDRKMPCVQNKISKIGFIVNILNKGGDLIDSMAKFFEVPVEIILDKYRSMESQLIVKELD